jgi:hypothetical protein
MNGDRTSPSQLDAGANVPQEGIANSRSHVVGFGPLWLSLGRNFLVIPR